LSSQDTKAGQVTDLIGAWRSGDNDALNELMPHVYSELHRLASRQMRSESGSHTLQATALVNEAFMRLANVQLTYNDRAHFLAMAARTMRRILVDHARAKKSVKRGGGERNLTLPVEVPDGMDDNLSVLDLHTALESLAENDEGLASVVELVYFGGLTYEEVAAACGKTKTQVFDDMQIAKAWLKNSLAD
jgi:RNA polymerase sigma factor (TIGR02999 family)